MAGKSYIKTGSQFANKPWSKIKKMYFKTGPETWTSIKKAYIKTGSLTWKKVFDSASNTPFITNGDSPKIRLNTYRTNSTSLGAINPPVEAPPVQYVGPRSNGTSGTQIPSGTASQGYDANDGIGLFLWGYDGTWNTTTGVTFQYDWFWNNTLNVDTASQYIPANAANREDKISNTENNLGFLVSYESFGVWVWFRVRATNSSGTNQVVSAPVQLIKQPTKLITFSMNTPGATPLNVPKSLTINIENKWWNSPDQANSKIEWFSETSLTSPSLNSSTLVQTDSLYSFTGPQEGDGTALTNSPSYTPVNLNSKGYSDVDKYIFAELTLVNSENYYSNTIVKTRVNTTNPVGQIRTYTPQWGEYIKVSTNGYIGLADSSILQSVYDTSTRGSVASFLNKDLKQIHLKYYASDTIYIVDYAAKLYQATESTITYRYQAHFYPGQPYIDFHVILNAGGTSENAFLFNGEPQTSWGSSKPSTTAYRLYLTGGINPVPISYSPRSTTTGFTTNFENAEIDDGVTNLLLQQGVVPPENISRPVIQLLSGTENKVGSSYRLSSGTWSNSPTEYKYAFLKNDLAGTEIVNSGWISSSVFDYTFTTATTQTVVGYVYARNAGGEGIGAVSTQSIGPIIAQDLVAPTIISVTSGYSGESVSAYFTGGSGPYYQIFWYGLTSAPISAVTADGVGASSPVTDSTGPGAAQYYMYIRSTSTQNETSIGPSALASAWSPGFAFTVLALPDTPTFLTATTNRSDGVNLEFGGSTNATSYDIFYNFTASSTPSPAAFRDFTTTATSYLDTSLLENSTRYYWVRARNSNGVSAWFPAVTGVTGTRIFSRPSSPTPYSASYSNSQFNIDFYGGSGPFYQAWYQNGNAVLFGTTSSFFDASGSSSPLTKSLAVTEGATYYWWVRSARTVSATGATDVSDWSGPVSVTIPVTPVIPTITMGTNTNIGSTTGTINWTSTNQASFSSSGTFSGTGTTATSIAKTGLAASTTYSGAVTVTSRTGHTSSAGYNLTTSAPAAVYTITYGGNGNTGGSTASTTGNGSVTLASNGFTRTNCTFVGWNDGGTTRGAGSAYTLSENKTFTAIWAAVANSCTAPGGFAFRTPVVNNNRTWTWSNSGTVTGGVKTGITGRLRSSPNGAITTITLDVSSRSYVVNASAARYLDIATTYTDGLGVARVGTYTAQL